VTSSSVTVIRPRKLLSLDLKEIWAYRELFYIFAWRDIKVRYKQTILGVAWVVFQPVVSTFIFTILFGRLADIPSGNLPYSLFVMIGLIFWNFFSNSLNSASNSLVNNEHIIKKVYFPKIILPFSSILTGLVDLGVSLLLLMGYTLFIGYTPHFAFWLILPLAIIFTTFCAFGIGLFFCALNVKYRDVRYILPFFFQTLMFLTPVIYSLEIISGRNSVLMALNPMTSVIELNRHCFSGLCYINFNLALISILASTFYFVVGYWYFKRTEYLFADIV